ncbi:MMPL family transporter, partial [Streptomyces laculatispora]|uniref:MMPL family transporter n=1 Tax=Streptomyces laculatispora TaxID=887464 RepID=UPI001A942C82
MAPPSGSTCAALGKPRGGWLLRLGEWCARHFVVVIIAWVIALGGLHALQSAFGGTYSDNFSLPGTQSNTGAELLKAHDPAAGGIGAQVVLHDAHQPLTEVRSQVDQAVSSLQKLPHVLSAQNPLPSSSSPTSTALSKDGTIGYITVRFDVNPPALDRAYLHQVDTAVRPLRTAGVDVEYGGPLGELARPETKDRTSEAIGFVVAVVVLLIGFGSIIAAAVPLLTALISVVVGLSILSLVAAATAFASVSPTLATMIGLGVGIDYALFLITRHRQTVMDGGDPVRAAGRAVATSGRAVLVSGCTVIVALAGLYVSRVSFIGKLGAAAAVTVITAVIGAVTLVPALLGLIGRRIDRYRVRPPVAEGGAVPGTASQGGWHRYAQRVERRPWWFLLAGLVVVGVLAIPLFSIRLGHIDDGADPTSFTDRRAFDLISTGFGPGANGPFTLVVDQSAVPGADRSALASSLQRTLADVPGAAGVSPLRATDDGALLIGNAVSAEAPQDAGTTTLFNHLKDDVLPKGVSGTEASAYVTGTTAAQEDFLGIIVSRLPLIIAVVVGLAFVIILIVFRGVLAAVKAAVLNLLSIAASYGVVV